MNPHQWPALYDPRDQRNHRSHRNYSDVRSFSAYPGQQAGGFPGDGFGYTPTPPSFGQQLPAAPTPSAGGGSGLFSNFNLSQIKSVVDRLGGIDGILSTVGKVQKIVSNIQQMQPMIKLLMNMMPGKSNSTSAGADDEEEWKRRPRRRKRRRRKGKRKAYTRSTVYNPKARRRRNPYW